MRYFRFHDKHLQNIVLQFYHSYFHDKRKNQVDKPDGQPRAKPGLELSDTALLSIKVNDLGADLTQIMLLRKPETNLTTRQIKASNPYYHVIPTRAKALILRGIYIPYISIF